MSSFTLSKFSRDDLIVLSDVSNDESYAFAYDRVVGIFDMGQLSLNDALNALDINQHFQVSFKMDQGKYSKICSFSVPYELPRIGLNPIDSLFPKVTVEYLDGLRLAKEHAFKAGLNMLKQAGHSGANLIKVRAFTPIYSPFFSFPSFDAETFEEVRVFNSTFKAREYGCLLELGGLSKEWNIDFSQLPNFQLSLSVRRLTTEECDKINENTRCKESIARHFEVLDETPETIDEPVYAVSVMVVILGEENAEINSIQSKFVAESNQLGLPFVRHGLALETSLRSFLPGQGFLCQTPLYFGKNGAHDLLVRFMEAMNA